MGKLLCEIKKKEKATIWRKIWDKVVAAPEKKYDQNSCTIPQIIAIIEYQIFMKKKIILFLSKPHDCTPKTLLIESGVTITVFFLHPIPLFVSNSPPTYYPPLLCITTANQIKLGHNILNCKNGWILSALKKRCLNKKTLPKKVSK